MNRYFGFARGRRRRKKPLPLFAILAVVTAGTFLAAVIVFVINPGSDVPDEEKGSATPSLVTPETTPKPPTPTESE